METTVRSVKHPFQAGMLPVHRSILMAGLLIGSGMTTSVIIGIKVLIRS
jgi:hypothetical protein